MKILNVSLTPLITLTAALVFSSALLLAPLQADAALSIVQFPAVPSSGSGAWYINDVDTTRTFGSDTTSGNLIVVMVSTWGGTGVADVTDNKGNNYSQAVKTADGNANIAIFYAENITGGSSHQVTVDLATGGYGVFTMIEVAGAATSEVLDSGASATANTNSNGSGISSVTSGTLAQADSIAFALMNVDAPGSSAITVSSPWSDNEIWARADWGFDSSGHASYQIVSATSPLTATWDSAFSNEDTARGIAVFKAASEGRVALSRPANNLGLVGYWSFDDGTGTVATDFSGNGNAGTLVNSPTWVNGKRGKALSFDGANSYVSVPDSDSLDISGNGTVSAWVKRSVLGTWDAVIDKGESSAGDTGHNYTIDISDTDYIQCSISNGVGVNRVDTPAIISDLNFHHIVCVWDGSNVQVYVDGVFVDQETQTISPAGDSNALGIGEWGAVDDDMNGIIDEVRIYNRALGAAEIAALGKTRAVRFSTNSSVLQQGTTLMNGLVGHWTFDGGDTTWTSGSAGTTRDGSGNGNTGTMTNMFRDTAVAQGKLGQALSFDGTADYVAVENASSLEGMSALSVGVWAYVPNDFSASGGDWNILLEKYDGAHIYAIQAFNAGQTDMDFVLRTSTETSTGFVDIASYRGQWVHLAATYDGATTRTYVNGVFANQSSQSGAVETNIARLTVGGREDSNDINHFYGKIDDVRIYNRALTAAEVKQLYLLGTVKAQ